MKYRIALLLLLAALAEPILAGTVVTSSGETLTGEVVLLQDHLKFTPEQGAPRDIPLDNVLQADFAPAATAPVAYGKTRRDKPATGPRNVLVEYFADSDFKDRRLARYESSINVSWDHKVVAEPSIPDRPSVRFTGSVTPRFSLDYTFTAEVHGAVRLWIDGKIRIDQPQAKGANKFTATVPLIANKAVAVRMEVLPGTTSFLSRLVWSSGKSVGKELIPSQAWSSPADAPQPPRIALTAPADEAQLRNPDAVPLQVSLTPAGAKIMRVDFLAGTQVIASAVAPPYQSEWKEPQAGQYWIKARALDEYGLSADSEPVEVSVADAGENHSLPAPWGQQSLGKKDVRIPGVASFENGTFKLSKAGGQITEDDDTPQFVYQPVSGDFQIIAHLASLTPRDNTVGPLAGILLRENMTGRDRFMALVVSPQATLLARRADFWSRTISNDRNDPPASWLKIVRYGNRLRAYTSADGKSWSLYGSERIDFPQRLFVGLCAMARNKQTPAHAEFDHVSVIPGPPEMTYSAQGILFRSGTFLAADVAGMKETTITYTHNGQRITIPNAEVARLIYKPVPAEVAEKIPTDRTGLALASGDFIEGDIKEVSYRVTVSNLVFGPRTFGIKNNEVLAIYFKDAREPALRYVVTTRDSSVYQSKSIKVENDTISMDDPALGIIHLSMKELSALKLN